MDILFFAALVSGECMMETCVSYEYMVSPPTLGVQVLRIDKNSDYLVFSGRKSSSEYMEGLNIINFDTKSQTFRTKKDASLNSPAPRSHYGIFDANQEWMYLFGGIGLGEIYGDLWRYNIALLYWEKIFEGSTITPRYNFQYTTIYSKETNSAFLAIVGGVDKAEIGLKDFYIINVTDGNYKIYQMPSLNESCMNKPLLGGQLQYEKNKYYLFSGTHNFRSIDSDYFQGLCTFNYEENEWKNEKLLNSLPKSAQGGSLYVDGTIFYYYGKNTNEYNNKIYRVLGC